QDRFVVPLQMDFRGRINPLPFFNFTRQDYARSLFLFDHGEPIGEEGLRYLKAHVAACADGNKWSTIERPGNLDLAGRIAWTDANLERLRKIGNAVLQGDDPAQWEWVLQQDIADPFIAFDPARFKWLVTPVVAAHDVSYENWHSYVVLPMPRAANRKVQGISDPYVFLAACAELAQALNTGLSFETRLPLMFDATCSGLQHICAMMRAPEGRLVNLTKPQRGGDRVVL